MVENNPKGREARRYFIEVEKRYRGDYRIKELESQINSLKVEIYDKTRENAELKRAINRITKNAEKEKSLLPAKRGGNVAFLDYIRYEERLHATDLRRKSLKGVLYRVECIYTMHWKCMMVFVSIYVSKHTQKTVEGIRYIYRASKTNGQIMYIIYTSY